MSSAPLAASALDATALLEARKSRAAAVVVERDPPATLDLVLLCVSDHEGVPEVAYAAAGDDLAARDALITSHAREGVQLLLNAVFNRPTTIIDEGVLAQLPTPAQQSEADSFILPREKPLPKPRPETKWERFAKQKGIAPRAKKDRLVYDEEKQDWVPRYGYKGKNKDAEDQWLVEVPAGKDADYDPRAVAKAERKARSLKNEGQRLRNVARAAGKPTSTQASVAAATPSTADNIAANAKRSTALKSELIASRKSTASMGKYDRPLAGESSIVGRERGQKRKFESNERSAADERERGLDTLSRLGKGGPPPPAAKRSKPSDTAAGGLINTRKAIRSVSRGGGSAALAGRGSNRGRGGSRGGSRGGKRK